MVGDPGAEFDHSPSTSSTRGTGAERFYHLGRDGRPQGMPQGDGPGRGQNKGAAEELVSETAYGLKYDIHPADMTEKMSRPRGTRPELPNAEGEEW